MSCDRPIWATGLCQAHYKRLRKTGDLNEDVPVGELPRGPRKKDVRPVCAVDECGGEVTSRGWCRRHYQRFMRYGDPLKVSAWASGNREGSEKWVARRRKPGDRASQQEGYVYVFQPESPMANSRGLVLEHRWVLAQHLGREIAPDETVHHKNGVRDDNSLENLELWSGLGKQPRGQRPDELVEYARRILDRYAGEVDSGLL